MFYKHHSSFFGLSDYPPEELFCLTFRMIHLNFFITRFVISSFGYNMDPELLL